MPAWFTNLILVCVKLSCYVKSMTIFHFFWLKIANAVASYIISSYSNIKEERFSSKFIKREYVKQTFIDKPLLLFLSWKLTIMYDVPRKGVLPLHKDKDWKLQVLAMGRTGKMQSLEFQPWSMLWILGKPCMDFQGCLELVDSDAFTELIGTHSQRQSQKYAHPMNITCGREC